ncbi:MAG TPA: hypothetical protein PK250_00585 [Syntrophobacter fumaroxidans]|nr:hypothetical protein [Syntrophobacter fumaroxidans]
MSFEQWGYEFDGAYSVADRLQPRAGVYVVWCKIEDKWKVIGVGQSENVGKQLVDGERALRWADECKPGTIYFAATYTDGAPESERKCIEQLIRRLTNNVREGA